MADLTADEQRQIRELLARESVQKQESIKASKSNFISWLKRVSSWIAGKVIKAGIEIILEWLFPDYFDTKD